MTNREFSKSKEFVELCEKAALRITEQPDHVLAKKLASKRQASKL